MSTRTTRADDIVELERMLNAGEGDEALSDQAIRIFDRLGRDDKFLRGHRDPAGMIHVRTHKTDFRAVLAEIRRRRHAHVLIKFDRHEWKKRPRVP